MYFFNLFQRPARERRQNSDPGVGLAISAASEGAQTPDLAASDRLQADDDLAGVRLSSRHRLRHGLDFDFA